MKRTPARAVSIKTRILLVMTALLLMNTATATASWVLNARAARFANEARSSLQRAQATQRASESVTEFVADNRALAFSVSHDARSEYSSEDYGQVIGSDRTASLELERLVARMPGDAAVLAKQQWESLQLASYAWVNAEAEQSGAPLRMSLMANGSFRASTSSNISVPPELSSLGLEQLSRAVTQRGDVLRKATLRSLVTDASARATAATRAEAEARALSPMNPFAFIWPST